MSKENQVKFWVVMETNTGEGVLRQEVCVFDNQGKYLCDHPEQIDLSEVWKCVRVQGELGGLIIGQYQKEGKIKSIKMAIKESRKK